MGKVLQAIFEVNRMQIVLWVCKKWALAIIYFAKILEIFGKLILSIPDPMLQPVANLTRTPKTADGKNIKILRAFNEKGDITNKFKIFLNWYWTNASEATVSDNSGFLFHKYSGLLQSSLLYCSYLVHDNDIDPHTFLDNIQRIFVSKDGVRINGNTTPLVYDHISFDRSTKLKDSEFDAMMADINLEDMLRPPIIDEPDLSRSNLTFADTTKSDTDTTNTKSDTDTTDTKSDMVNPLLISTNLTKEELSVISSPSESPMPEPDIEPDDVPDVRPIFTSQIYNVAKIDNNVISPPIAERVEITPNMATSSIFENGDKLLARCELMLGEPVPKNT